MKNVRRRVFNPKSKRDFYDEFDHFLYVEFPDTVTRNSIATYSVYDHYDFDIDLISEKLSTNKVMIEFTEGARTGAIGQIVAISNDDSERFYPTMIVEFEDHNNHRVNIEQWQRNFIVHSLENGADLQSRWVYKTAKKQPVEPHVNAFGQQLEVGKLAIMSHNKRLYIGRISRYTKANIWLQVYGNLRKNQPTSKELMADLPTEVFLLPSKYEDAAFPMRMLGAPMPDPDSIFGD